MKKLVVYIHGAGGNALEANHYKGLFPDSDVIGFDYQSKTPWDSINEFVPFFENLIPKYSSLTLIANSIGAFFSLHALSFIQFEKVYFVSPVVDMEKLITNMMQLAGVTEKELEKMGIIHTNFGQDLSWEYLTWVRNHPITWNSPTAILYGAHDNMQTMESICNFAKKCGAAVTVMEDGEHWFHTDEQMAFLDQWMRG